MHLPGYDVWKTNSPEPTEAQEREAIEQDEREQADLREAIADMFHDHRRSIYLATIREIVIEELNKLKPQPGEPLWQTRTPVPVPKMG